MLETCFVEDIDCESIFGKGGGMRVYVCLSIHPPTRTYLDEVQLPARGRPVGVHNGLEPAQRGVEPLEAPHQGVLVDFWVMILGMPIPVSMGLERL